MIWCFEMERGARSSKNEFGRRKKINQTSCCIANRTEEKNIYTFTVENQWTKEFIIVANGVDAFQPDGLTDWATEKATPEELNQQTESVYIIYTYYCYSYYVRCIWTAVFFFFILLSSCCFVFCSSAFRKHLNWKEHHLRDRNENKQHGIYFWWNQSRNQYLQRWYLW